MYLDKCKNIEELKAAYRAFTKQLHPDLGGSTEDMKRLNNEYDRFFEILKNRHNATADEAHQTTETAAEYMNLINRIIHFNGLEIELCGSWVWIGGNTYPYKAELKEAGCRWSNSKKKWYWRHEEEGLKRHRGTATMAEIRIKYGSHIFEAEPQAALA